MNFAVIHHNPIISLFWFAAALAGLNLEN